MNDAIRPLFFILPKIGEYVRTFKDKDSDKDKNKNNTFMSFRLDGGKLLEKYKTIWT